MTLPLAVRIRSKLIAEGDCLLWTGTKSKGYGKIVVGKQTLRVHRVWWLAHGREIPDGMELDHLCRRRACVCLNHLEVVTSRENTLRGEGRAAENASKMTCLRGHEFSVRRNGWRQCLECQRLRDRARYAKKKQRGF